MTTSSTQVTNGGWTSLGQGPMAVQAVEGEVFIAIGSGASGAPASGTVGNAFVLRREDGRLDFNTSSGIYAQAAIPQGYAISGATVITSPMIA